MLPTAFCPAPHCQRRQPYTVGEDGVRRCAYCKKDVGREEVRMEQIPVDENTITIPNPLEGRVAALEEKTMASERWLGGPEERLLHLRGQHDALQVQVNTLEDRVNGLVTVIAAMKASPPGGKPAMRHNKKPTRRR